MGAGLAELAKRGLDGDTLVAVSGTATDDPQAKAFAAALASAPR